MHWVAAFEKDTATDILEKRLCDTIEQAGPGPFIAWHPALTGQPSPGSASHPLPVVKGRARGNKIKSHNGRFDFVLAYPPFNVNAVDKERLKGMVEKPGVPARAAFYKKLALLNPASEKQEPSASTPQESTKQDRGPQM